MRVADSDLTASARIRNAALEGFARDGLAGTTIRDVANAAGVSPGLVQHHFKTKADLEQAVNDYVLQIAVEASEGLEEATSEASTEELFLAMGERTMELVRDHRSALLYVIRSAANGEKAGLDIFDAFLALVNRHVERLAKEGTLRDDVDRLWLGLQVVILDLGTVLLEPAIDRHLPRPLLEPDQLDRWRKACTELLRQGFVKA
jgi:TetR/AcrR family transcriptional regulator, regulator of cefoperazone and chloramphenicol sensitivity